MSRTYPSWFSLPYYNETELPKGVNIQAGQWPLQFYTKDLAGQFYDLQSYRIYFNLMDPNRINFAVELAEVVKVQQELINNPNDIRVKMAKFWGAGVPVQQWTPIALQLINSYKVTPPSAGRIMSYLQRGINDAFVICWYYKYLFETPRPCQLDHNLKTVLNTPRFPAYPSGHSVVSGVCEVVLSYYFPTEAKKLNQLAEEASISRLYGGIHYRSDLEQGIKLGRQIGNEITSVAKMDRDYYCYPADTIYREDVNAPIMPKY